MSVFKNILYSKEEIENKVLSLSKKIEIDYSSSTNPPVFIGVLKGCLPFLSDLTKNINLDIILEYIEASSWEGGTESTGSVKITKELSTDLTGKDILIVEDIIDSGITLEKIVDYLNEKSPKSIKIITLMDKPSGRVSNVNINVDYFGFTVPDEFLVGYGLDYKGLYRNIPAIGVLKDELI